MSRHVAVTVFFSLAVMLAGCGGGGGASKSLPPVAPGLQATTTLSAETGNNTSAAASFTAQVNGTAGAGNVSKVQTASLLYPGATTRIYAHLMPWFGGTNHMDVGYHSDDPAQVKRQVEDMMSRGISGAIEFWGGANSSAAALALKQQAEAHAGFQFAMSEDSSALGAAAVTNHCAVTDQLISDLNTIASEFESSPAYLRINDRPVVFFFGQGSYYVDWAKVRAAVPDNPIFMFRGTAGLTVPAADGGFQWLDLQFSDPFNPELGAQDAFYSTALQAPGRVAFGSAYKGFNDNLAKWGSDRLVQQSCGQTWLATFAEIGKFYSAGHQLPALQVVTWNDYEEGTAIEPGIDNCVYLTPAITGNTLTWSVAGGNENTIDHYTIFISSNGQDLASLGDVPGGTHSFDLGRSSLPAGTYGVYVKAVGRPSIQNKMSPVIAYHPGDQPPKPSLAISQTGDLSFQVSTVGSSDADGSIASSQIDFGDGTVVNGPTATHTYAAVGSYTITATVTDNQGASALAIKRISAKAPESGVTLISPVSGANVNWPTALMASANLAAGVSRMNVYVDNQLVYATAGDTINTPLKIMAGTHQLMVQAVDNAGASASATATITAEPRNMPPSPTLTIQPMPSISALAVLACTAGSSDADGFILKQRIQFSDGAVYTTPGALHIFASPGSYSTTATVTDQFGASGTTSQSITVPQ